MQRILAAGEIPLAYDRLTKYGVPHPKVRLLGKRKLAKALDHWAGLLGEYGIQVDTILTGGLFVDKGGQHAKGIAIDVDGIIVGGKNFMALSAPDNWQRYLALEATLRQVFGQVLNYDYNKAHRDHWHCDLSQGNGFRKHSRAQTLFMQRALNTFWDAGLRLDGEYGPLTSACFAEHIRLSVGLGWDTFLHEIAIQYPKPKHCQQLEIKPPVAR